MGREGGVQSEACSRASVHDSFRPAPHTSSPPPNLNVEHRRRRVDGEAARRISLGLAGIARVGVAAGELLRCQQRRKGRLQASTPCRDGALQLIEILGWLAAAAATAAAERAAQG